MFNRHRATRVFLVQYLFSSIFNRVFIDDLVKFNTMEDENFYYDEKFLNKLLKTYDLYKIDIYECIDKCNNRSDNVDFLIFATLVAAAVEMYFNNHRVVISEYLKICDILEINSGFVNGVLDKISKEILPKMEPQKEKDQSKKNQDLSRSDQNIKNKDLDNSERHKNKDLDNSEYLDKDNCVGSLDNSDQNTHKNTPQIKKILKKTIKNLNQTEKPQKNLVKNTTPKNKNNINL